MHTLEIAGDPIAIANGAKDEAIELFNQEEFRLELIVFGFTRETPGNEKTTKFVVRQSFPHEDLIFEKDFARAVAAGEIAATNERAHLAFLAPVGEMLG